MCVVERIAGTAGRYVLAGALRRDDSGCYVAQAAAYLLTATDRAGPLRSVATASASSITLQARGATASEARMRFCVVAKEQLAASVTNIVWHPAVHLAVAR